MRTTFAILIGILASLSAPLIGRAEIVVVDEAKPGAVIVVPQSPMPEESLSAERLRYYIGKITGTSIEIVDESKLEGKDAPSGRIYIGRTRAAMAVMAKLKQRSAPAEASLVECHGNEAFVTGVDPIGTLHATYFLMEDFGCRWYIPADWGTVIPKTSRLVIADQSTYRAPSFKLRSGLTDTTVNLDADPTWAAYEWGRGNHLGGWRWWGAGHSYRFMIPAENFKTHPEWFALVNGKRIPDQLCISNPEGRAFALQNLRKELAAYGDHPPELICISPNDTTADKFCQCAGCQKYVPTKPDGTRDFNSGMDRIIAYANFFADDLKDEYPNSRVLYMVDYHSHDMPSLVKPAPNSAFWVIHWMGDQFHGQNDSTRMGQTLTRWGTYGLPELVYTYWGSHTSWSFWPVVHSIRQEVPYYHKKGVAGICSETHENWGAQHLNFIVYPRLMWDANTDVDAWINDFCQKFYGPAARPMREYYTLLEQAAQNGPPQHRYRQTLIPTFTPEVLSGLRQKIAAAQIALRGQDEVYQKRFAFVKAGFETGDLYFSAEQLMRTYPKTHDPTIRPRMVQMMGRALELAEDPQFKHLIGVYEYPLVDDIRKIYEQYRQGTTFATGEFAYFDDYYLGGLTFIDAQGKSGFIDDLYGLSLDGGNTGTLIYCFDTHDNAIFKQARGSLVLTSSTKVNPIKLSARTSSDQPWKEITFAGDGTNVEFELSPLVVGQSEVSLKIELTNSAARNTHVLHQLHFNGQVCPRSN
ncbi:MAG: DUF4838 domain-containing protein [Phycisphaerales bacterium]|jgi:hypothetical protein|nr:DUF4838 domain-containing protein [Phycisphaerales bacterium]